jgi:hypothetical protein
MSSLRIKKIEQQQGKIPQVKAAELGVIPKHPFRLYVVGHSGSGKSNLVLNLLTRKDFYKGYFDAILVISPTALVLDKSYKSLKIPPELYFPVEEQVLIRVMEIQQEAIQKVKRKEDAPKVLVLMDDIVSYSDFIRSPIFLKFAVMSRHWNISTIIISQAYHLIPKSVRLQMSAFAYFKGTNRELEVLAEDLSAPGYSKRHFMECISKATDERFSFLFVDLHLPVEQGRYRKNLEHSICRH